MCVVRVVFVVLGISGGVDLGKARLSVRIVCALFTQLLRL